MCSKIYGGGFLIEQIDNNDNTLDSINGLQNQISKSDFGILKEVLQIDSVGVIRMSKLVEEHIDNNEIFSSDFQRILNFYRNFLQLDIRVNIIENELFAGYKKVNIDFYGKYNSQIWDFILNNIIPTLETNGFIKNFISFEILRDLPKKFLKEYIEFSQANFVFEDGNIIKNIILWLDFALSTRFNNKKGIGDINEIIKGNPDFEHLMIMIAHISKLDSEFQDILEFLYIKLVRYRDPKAQGLLLFLQHIVNEHTDSKGLINRIRMRFSVKVAGILGNFGSKKGNRKVDLISSQINISPETNLFNTHALGRIESQSALLPFAKTVAKIFELDEFKLDEFEGIITLEKIFLNRKKLDIKSVFSENVRQFINGELFFDTNGKFYINASINKEEIFKIPYFSTLILILINQGFDDENLIFNEKEFTYVDFVTFVQNMQVRLSSYLDIGLTNGIDKLLLSNLQMFKNDKKKRKILLEIILLHKQGTNSNLKDLFKELGKIDKEFRKLYILQNIPKVKKIQVLKTLLQRNDLELIDVWEHLDIELKHKFFYPILALFNNSLQEYEFNRLLIQVRKEFSYLLGEQDLQKIMLIFKSFFLKNKSHSELKMLINSIPNNNIILIDLREYFLECLSCNTIQFDNNKNYLKDKIMFKSELIFYKKDIDLKK